MVFFPMTQHGIDKLRAELKELKLKRPRIISAIAKARKHGDLRENAEYHAAREEQEFYENRIKEIENKLSNARVIDVTKVNANGKVIFGATVTVLNINDQITVTYRIVGDDEADFRKSLISISSPVARGLIGKKKNDIVTINTPIGSRHYKIIKIEYI